MPKDVAYKQETITTGNTSSLWIDSVKPIFFSPLKEDVTTDVVIVGGGITGMSTAYQLINAGIDVVLIEDGAIGSGETGRTTAHTSNALDDRYYSLIQKHGEKNAKLIYESHTEAIEIIESISRKEKINCDFQRVDGYLYPGPGYDFNELKKELSACRKIGFDEVEMVDRAPISFFDTGKALIFPNQAQFHSLKYLKGLANVIIEKGGKIYTETHAKDVKKDHVVTSDGKVIRANHIVLATNIPIGSITIASKIKAYRTYVLGIKVPKGKLPRILLWDTGDKRKKEDPYHYVRIHPHNKKNDILIIGNDDHEAGLDNGNQSFKDLEYWTRKKFPFVRKIDWKWSGHIVESIDYIGLIGKDNEYDGNVYVGTGYSGMGMTHGTIASLIIRDQILGKKNNWSKIYDPNRKNPNVLKAFLKVRIKDVKDLARVVTGGKKISVDDIPKGDGAVIKHGINKLAVYKDEKGRVHSYSAICTHMGCLVRWNSSEKTFDCPCHGSRYSCKGKVINGPAKNSLKPKELK